MRKGRVARDLAVLQGARSGEYPLWIFDRRATQQQRQRSATRRAVFWRTPDGVAPQSESAAAILPRRALPAVRQKTARPFLILIWALSTIGLLASICCAADIAGQWRGEFDSQIGQQKYLFTFKTDGDKLTGKASSEVNGEKRESDLKEGKITGDTIHFVETLNFNDNDIRIQYTGKVGTNEIAFHREVGDNIATEDFKATRVDPTAAPTNSPPATSTNK